MRGTRLILCAHITHHVHQAGARKSRRCTYDIAMQRFAYILLRAARSALCRIYEVIALWQEATVRHGCEYAGLPLDVIALLFFHRAGKHA